MYTVINEHHEAENAYITYRAAKKELDKRVECFLQDCDNYDINILNISSTVNKHYRIFRTKITYEYEGAVMDAMFSISKIKVKE